MADYGLIMLPGLLLTYRLLAELTVYRRLYHKLLVIGSKLDSCNINRPIKFF